MPDAYRSFAELSRHERSHAFAVQVVDRKTRVLVLAVHGGRIEPGSSEVATAIAAEALSVYTFEGLKASGNKSLHLTSHRFDEPRALKLVKQCDVALVVHGCVGMVPTTYLGGADHIAAEMIGARLADLSFRVRRHSDPFLQGLSPQNICNRGRLNRGIQLELSQGLRKLLLKDHGRLKEYGQAVREALQALFPDHG